MSAAVLPHDSSARSTNGGVWAGRILSGLVTLFLLLDGSMKIAREGSGRRDRAGRISGTSGGSGRDSHDGLSGRCDRHNGSCRAPLVPVLCGSGGLGLARTLPAR